MNEAVCVGELVRVDGRESGACWTSHEGVDVPIMLFAAQAAQRSH